MVLAKTQYGDQHLSYPPINKTMKIQDLIKEHNKIDPIHFITPRLDGGKDIGTISTKDFINVSVYQVKEGPAVQLIVHDGNNIIGFASFVEIPKKPKLWMAKNAQSNYPGQNLLYNLILFLKTRTRRHVISDYEMTESGEKAWQAMVRNPSLHAKIYNMKQNKTYNLNDPNIVKPEDDINSTYTDAQWYYIIESKLNPYLGETYYPSIIQPYYYKDLDIPDSL